MSLSTACPQCQTRFRVTQEQLDARGGKVRCGRCAHVFDAYIALSGGERATEATEEIEITSPEPSSPPHSPHLPEQMDEVPGIEEPAEIVMESPPDNEEPKRKARVVRVPSAPLETESDISLDNPKYAPPSEPKSSWPWALASVPLLLVLLGQSAYFYREAIAANYPPTRPLLEQACVYLQCSVELPQKPDMIGIDTSELHADPTRANIVVLTSVLHSRAPHVLAYPMLELTLTNTQDEMVARRVFAPKEYLPRTAAIAQGIPARGDISVKLLMDLGDLKAEGYRLYLFYPG
jgi:predicted Zn finger-like uncharacterized protein